MMTETPFEEKDALWRWRPTCSVRYGGSNVKEYCFVQEADGARQWIRTQNRWNKEFRVAAWQAELLRQLRESQEREKKMMETLKAIERTDEVNSYDAPSRPVQP
jgi:hypothetical protein